jgi:hypothetical protein
MKATLTSKGQVTSPTAIRRRLGPVFDEEAMRAVVGCTRGRLGKTSDEWLDETRGRVDERDR